MRLGVQKWAVQTRRLAIARAQMPQASQHAVVVGAGFAGLAAAQALVQAGAAKVGAHQALAAADAAAQRPAALTATAAAQVTVLEASHRVGGRAHTAEVWPASGPGAAARREEAA